MHPELCAVRSQVSFYACEGHLMKRQHRKQRQVAASFLLMSCAMHSDFCSSVRNSISGQTCRFLCCEIGLQGVEFCAQEHPPKSIKPTNNLHQELHACISPESTERPHSAVPACHIPFQITPESTGLTAKSQLRSHVCQASSTPYAHTGPALQQMANPEFDQNWLCGPLAPPVLGAMVLPYVIRFIQCLIVFRTTGSSSQVNAKDWVYMNLCVWGGQGSNQLESCACVATVQRLYVIASWSFGITININCIPNQLVQVPVSGSSPSVLSSISTATSTVDQQHHTCKVFKSHADWCPIYVNSPHIHGHVPPFITSYQALPVMVPLLLKYIHFCPDHH